MTTKYLVIWSSTADITDVFGARDAYSFDGDCQAVYLVTPKGDVIAVEVAEADNGFQVYSDGEYLEEVTFNDDGTVYAHEVGSFDQW